MGGSVAESCWFHVLAIPVVLCFYVHTFSHSHLNFDSSSFPNLPFTWTLDGHVPYMHQAFNQNKSLRHAWSCPILWGEKKKEECCRKNDRLPQILEWHFFLFQLACLQEAVLIRWGLYSDDLHSCEHSNCCCPLSIGAYIDGQDFLDLTLTAFPLSFKQQRSLIFSAWSNKKKHSRLNCTWRCSLFSRQCSFFRLFFSFLFVTGMCSSLSLYSWHHFPVLHLWGLHALHE